MRREGRPKGRKNLSKFFLSCNKVWILFHNINTFISDIVFCKHFFNEIQVFVLHYILNSLVYFIIKLHIVWIFFLERPEIYKNSDFLSEFFCDPFVSKKKKKDEKRLPSGHSGESASQCRRHRHEFDSWVGKIPWIGNGHPLQYSWLENSIDRGTWQARLSGTAESDMTEQGKRLKGWRLWATVIIA